MFATRPGWAFRGTLVFSLGLLFFLALSTSAWTQLNPRDYERLCELQKGEVLKRVAPPFAASRDAWYYENHREAAIGIGGVPTSMVFRVEKGKSTLHSWSSGGSGMKLSWLLREVANVRPDRHRHEITGDQNLLDTDIPGDFAYSGDAAQEQVVQRLETVLQAELGLKVRIRKQLMERDVYLMRGEYKPEPTEKAPKRIEGSGPFRNFVRDLSGWIERPVESEVAAPPASRMEWYAQLDDVRAIERHQQDEDVQRLLDHVTRQTGFTFTKTKRPTPVLLVEPTDE